MIDVRCEHLNTATETAVYRLHNEADPERPFFSVALKVDCPDCKAMFRFLGDMPLASTSTVEAVLERGGAWVSGTADASPTIV